MSNYEYNKDFITKLIKKELKQFYSRFMFIMSGIPGSGKSTFAKRIIVSEFDYIEYYSADFYRIDSTGAYKFHKNDGAHETCLRNVTKSLVLNYHKEQHSIIIDNTNISILNVSPYYYLARAYGYHPVIIRMVADIDICVDRNIHKVPKDVIEKMEQDIFPLGSIPWDGISWIKMTNSGCVGYSFTDPTNERHYFHV